MAFAGDDELAALRDVHTASYVLNAPPEQGRAADLPQSILELLFTLVDTPTFVSLSVLNKHWHSFASASRFPAYHLALHTFPEQPLKEKWDTYSKGDSILLKRELARLSKQHLFPAYRPRLATFHIIAPAVLSSTSAPHGEFFSYSFSPSAAHLAVYSACRLFVLDLRGSAPRVVHAVSIRQRPLAVEVSNDGSRLALLVSELKLQVFTSQANTLVQSHAFLMDDPARALALSADATLLAASQSKAVELFALSPVPGRIPRRLVACDSVSHLAFSSNGKLLLGSHTRSSKASTTVISAPDDMDMSMGDVENDDDDSPREDTATVWISRPLFPSAYERTTHATLLPGDQGSLLAYDEPADSFGILDSQLMSFAHSLLIVPSDFVQPSSLPTVTSDGDLAAIPFSRSGIRVLNISKLPSQESDDFSVPQMWMPFSKAVSKTRWQSRPGHSQRLVSVSAGKSTHPELVNDNADEQRETGSIFIFDFDSHGTAAKAKDVIMDMSQYHVQVLETGGEDADSINVQKRPVSSRASDRPASIPLARSVTAARRKQKARASIVPEEGSSIRTSAGAPEDYHLEEIYHPSMPRPQASLIRSATTIAANRERQPPRFLASEELRIRQAGDPSEIPDESDADNWVPPPPAYDPDEESRRQARLDVRGARLPPVPPERSPNRPRLTVSTSTPDLQRPAKPASSEGQSSSATSTKPSKLQRPNPKRVKSAYENARSSIVLTTQSARRTLTKPMTDARSSRDVRSERPPAVPPKDSASIRPLSSQIVPQAALSKPEATKHISVSNGASKRSSERIPHVIPGQPPNVGSSIRRRPVSVAVPQQSLPHTTEETFPKRRSLIQRPLSFSSSGLLDARPGNRRSVSLPITNSLHDFPAAGSPDSPSVPSPAQMASLHRRQTSGSISSINSNPSGPPRAAIGAIRASTNPNSPWSSSTMLAPLSEDGGTSFDADEGASTPRVNGRPVSGVFVQAKRSNATPPRRLQEARASLMSSGELGHSRGDSYSSIDGPSATATENGQTPKSGNGRRLTTIQSAASAIKERSQSRGSGINRTGSVRKSTAVDAGTRKKTKGFFGRLKAKLFGTLESV